MLKVTIDRAKWRTGRFGLPLAISAAGDSALLNVEGNRCCLGFLGQACGVDIEERSCYPRNVPGPWPAKLFDVTEHRSRYGMNCTWEDVFVSSNDADDTDDATREAWIAEGFRTVLDAEVEFIGEYPETTP